MRDDQRRESFGSELTPEGEQLVIPGCEKDDARTGAQQADLLAQRRPAETDEA